jgi:hypothetical protein
VSSSAWASCSRRNRLGARSERLLLIGEQIVADAEDAKAVAQAEVGNRGDGQTGGAIAGTFLVKLAGGGVGVARLGRQSNGGRGGRGGHVGHVGREQKLGAEVVDAAEDGVRLGVGGVESQSAFRARQRRRRG